MALVRLRHGFGVVLYGLGEVWDVAVWFAYACGWVVVCVWYGVGMDIGMVPVGHRGDTVWVWYSGMVLVLLWCGYGFGMVVVEVLVRFRDGCGRSVGVVAARKR